MGKSRIASINPVLYVNPQVFNDITEGESVMGWDPVTGLGPPKFNDLLELFIG